MTGFRFGNSGREGRRHGVWAALLVGAVFVTLSACTRAPALLVVLDPYEAEALGVEGLYPDRLEAAVAEAGRARVEILAPGDAAPDELRAMLRRTSPLGVYVSPLLVPAGAAAAADFPETLFFLDGSLPPGSASGGGNLRSVRYELAQAHAEAGLALGKLLTDPDPGPAIGALAESGRVPGVATVAVRPDKAAQRELQLFRETLLETGAVDTVEERELTSLDDRARARRTLERLREGGAGVFLLHASTLTGFCLEVLQKIGGVAIVEGLPGVEAYADVLLLTLERDVPAAFREMALTAAGGTAGEATAAGSVTAPVGLRWWGLERNKLAGNKAGDAEKEPGVDE